MRGGRLPGTIALVDTYSATIEFDVRKLKETLTYRNLREQIYPDNAPDAEVFDVLLEMIARGPA